jgi:hypothetical protein
MGSHHPDPAVIQANQRTGHSFRGATHGFGPFSPEGQPFLDPGVFVSKGQQQDNLVTFAPGQCKPTGFTETLIMRMGINHL